MAIKRKRRIRLSKDFDRLRQSGLFRDAGCFFLKIFQRNDNLPSRFAVVVSRKVGSAVERHLIKRRAQAIFAQSKLFSTQGLDILWIPRVSMKKKTYQDLVSIFAKLSQNFFT